MAMDVDVVAFSASDVALAKPLDLAMRRVSGWFWLSTCCPLHLTANRAFAAEDEIQMDFTLFYEGELRSDSGSGGRTADKHNLRKVFHPQLKRLWRLEPLASNSKYITYPRKAPDCAKPNPISFLETVGEFTFAPLISRRLWLAGK